MNTPSHHSPTHLGWGQDWRTPLVLALSALLGLQLLLALGLNLNQPGIAAPTTPTPLFDFASDHVTRIQLAGADDSAGVTLTRTPDGQWVLADLADFPAAASKVERLLIQLAALKPSLPVATSEEARQRFKVADTNVERRLTLDGQDGPLATLLLGDSPGFKRLFGRLATDPAIYDLSLSVGDVSTRRDDWLDPTLLQRAPDQITQIAGADWTLIRAEDSWRLDGSEQPVDQSKADALARRLANLRYRGALAATDQPADSQSPLTLAITLADGTAHRYQITPIKNSTDYALKDADQPYVFRFSDDDLHGLLDLDADKLILQPDVSDQSNDTAPSPSPDSDTVDPETTDSEATDPARSD